ncbi:MAG: tetratricopeptide repeat protein [Rhodanobacter sp.]|nr:MAG: tetratricopeptide repeat protein [Rhodanobacter sp.]
MSAALIASLRQQCGGPRDGALLRFSLGNALHADGENAEAIVELRRALVFDPDYSAAWKLLGKLCLQTRQLDAAAEAWRQGIAVATRRGDKQAEKEMTVFLRRLHQASP